MLVIAQCQQIMQLLLSVGLLKGIGLSRIRGDWDGDKMDISQSTRITIAIYCSQLLQLLFRLLHHQMPYFILLS